LFYTDNEVEYFENRKDVDGVPEQSVDENFQLQGEEIMKEKFTYGVLNVIKPRRIILGRICYKHKGKKCKHIVDGRLYRKR
jgi:hypothetical protein